MFNTGLPQDKMVSSTSEDRLSNISTGSLLNDLPGSISRKISTMSRVSGAVPWQGTDSWCSEEEEYAPYKRYSIFALLLVAVIHALPTDLA